MEQSNSKSTNSSRNFLIFALILLPLVAFGAINTFDRIVGTKLNVDNIQVDGNSLSTTNANGDLELDLNGTGSLILRDLTASKVLYVDSNKKLASSAADSDDLGNISGLGSPACGESDTCTFTNKTMSGASNTFTNIPNSATTAASTNTISTIVARDASGNFAAGTVTASLTGNVTGNVTGNLTGAVSAPDGSSAAPSISFSSDTNSGLYWVSADVMSMVAGSYEAIGISKATGNYANIGLGGYNGAALGNDTPLIIARDLAGDQVYAKVYNVNAAADSSGNVMVLADGATKSGEMAVYSAATTTDAYSGGALTLRSNGTTPGISYVADTSGTYHKFYVGGSAAGNKIATIDTSGITLGTLLGVIFDSDTKLYSSADNKLELIAGNYTALQAGKSTGNFANIGMGSTASTSDQYPLLISRTNANVGTYAQVANPDTGASSKATFQLSTDAGNNKGELSVFTAATATNAYADSMVVRPSDGTARLSLIGGDEATGYVTTYTGGDYASTGETMRFNADHTIQFMQSVASPTTPAAGVKIYVKSDGKVYKKTSGGTESEIGSGSGGSGSMVSVLTNSGFNEATVDTGWTSAAGTDTANTTYYMEGTQSLKVALSSVNGTIISQSVTPGTSLSGVNMEYSAWVKTSLTTVQVCALQAGTSMQCTSVPGSNTFQKIEMNIAGPSSGTVGLLFKTTSSTTGDIYVDDAYVGPSRGIGTVSQEKFVGEVYYAATASCSWVRTNTAYGDFTSDADCPSPTVANNGYVGTISTTDADLPQFTISSLPPGVVELSCEGSASSGGTAAAYAGLQISDGTDTRGTVEWYQNNTDIFPWHLTATFTYTSAGDRTFKFQAKMGGTSTIQISNGSSTAGPRCTIKLLPSANEQTVRPSQNQLPTVQRLGSGTNATYTPPTGVSYIKVRAVGGGGGGVGSGTVSSMGTTTNGGNTCFGTNATACTSPLIQANGGAGASQNAQSGGAGGTVTSVVAPAVQLSAFAGSRGGAGQYTAGGDQWAGGAGGQSIFGGAGQGVGAGAGGAADTNSGSGGAGGGTSTSGVFVGAGGGSGAYTEGLIYNPTTMYYTIGAAGSGGTLGTSGAAGGNGAAGYIEVTEYYGAMNAPLLVGSVTSNSTGMERIERVKVGTTACSSSPCTIASQSGSWVSSVTRTGTGAYTLNIASGIFSATPTCHCTSNAYASANTVCSGPTSGGTPSATRWDFNTIDLANAATDSGFEIICMGPR